MRAAAGGFLDIVQMLIHVSSDLSLQDDVSHCVVLGAEGYSLI